MYADKAIALAMPLMMCYLVYYIIWVSMSKRTNAQSSPGGLPTHNSKAAVDLTEDDEKHTVAWPDPAATAAAIRQMGVSSSPIRPVRSTWHERTQMQLASKPARQKFAELVESMLLSAVIASLTALAAVVVLMLRDQPPSEQMASYLWLAAVGTLGSWAVLIPSKFFEGKLEDHAPIRISLLLLGTLVGAAAWCSAMCSC